MSADIVFVPGGIGGTGGLSIDLRNLADGLGSRGYATVVAATGACDPAVAKLERSSVVSLRRIAPRSTAERFGLYAGLRRLLERHPDAAIHAFGCMPSYVTFAALAVGRSMRRTVVWTPMFHPLRSRLWEQRLRLRPMHGFDALVLRAARLADVVGAATEEEAETFRRVGVERVMLLPPVVHPVPIASARDVDAFRHATGVDGAPLVVLVASRNERRKGLDFACEAFTLLREALHDARLMIVGVEEGSQALPAGALSVGRVDDVTLAQALRSANVVFVPSLFEAFSRVVIEAWQQERPVVVSDGVALASTVLKERGGAVVPYGDARSAAAALRRLVSDAAMADAMGRRGRRAVDQRFTLPRLLDAYERLHLRRDPAKIQTPGRTRRAVDERRTRRS